jgi:hypothetical protein
MSDLSVKGFRASSADRAEIGKLLILGTSARWTSRHSGSRLIPLGFQIHRLVVPTFREGRGGKHSILMSTRVGRRRWTPGQWCADGKGLAQLGSRPRLVCGARGDADAGVPPGDPAKFLHWLTEQRMSYSVGFILPTATIVARSAIRIGTQSTTAEP